MSSFLELSVSAIASYLSAFSPLLPLLLTYLAGHYDYKNNDSIYQLPLKQGVAM